MKLEQSFEVDAPLERVWQALVDVERVAPCLPGAAVTGRNEDGSYNGTFTIKIGPTTASYAGKLEMQNIDEASHSATMHAQGSDRRGQGGATATINSRVTAADGSTRVEVVTDYHITGRLARFGRGGMIEDISERLLREFASRLQSSLSGAGAEPGLMASQRVAGGGEIGRPETEPVPPPTEVAAAAPAASPIPAAATPLASAADAPHEDQPTQPFDRLGDEPAPGGPDAEAAAEEPAVPEAEAVADEPPAPPVGPEPEAVAPHPPAETAAASAPEPEVAPPPPPPSPEVPTPPTPPPEPPTPPTPPPPPPSPPHAAPPPPPPETKPAAPVDGLSLVGSALLGRVKRNPKPLIALAGGLIVLGVIRRRR
jgi:uncharacterized protein